MFNSIDRVNKVSETDTHIFFHGGVLSQWYPCVFTKELTAFGKPYTFNCAEQYMMAAKAIMFDDFGALLKILNPKSTPREQKALGRTVTGFDEKKWNASAKDVVFRGNMAKFSADETLKKYLLDTGDKILVEGSPHDKIWGVGVSFDNPAIIDPANWNGTNWLGLTLMVVRDRFNGK